MGTIFSFKRRAEAFQADLAILQTMKEYEDDIGDLNKEQMYDGKTRLGTDITPSYYNDPYFKGDYQRAAAYSDWKDKITPNPRRTKGTPNLFINGYYYSSIVTKIVGDQIVYNSTWIEESDISAKFKNIYGLGGTYKSLFLNDYIWPSLSDKIQKGLGLKGRRL